MADSDNDYESSLEQRIEDLERQVRRLQAYAQFMEEEDWPSGMWEENRKRFLDDSDLDPL